MEMWPVLPAWVDYWRFKTDTELGMQFGGQLAAECCCWFQKRVLRALRGLDEDECCTRNTLLQEFAMVVENMIQRVWKMREQVATPRVNCVECGKVTFDTKEQHLALNAAVNKMRKALGLDF